MSATLLAIALLSATPWETARADYEAQPADVQPYLMYTSFEHTPAAEREWWEKVQAFVVPSCSRAVVLDRQIPVRVGTSWVYRLNLQDLKWDYRDWLKVQARYPYETDVSRRLLVVRGDWLIFELSDTTESQSYYRLLYGSENIPKTKTEFLKFWRVDLEAQPEFGFGLVEKRSGIAHQRIRWLEGFNKTAGYAWGTKDVLRVAEGTDPLDAPDGSFSFDGQELIVGIPKVSLKKRNRGALQVYFLANGKDERVEEAPVDLVSHQTDRDEFRRQTAVHTNGSCINCHTTGILSPTENGLISFLAQGGSLKAYSQAAAEAIERFHLGDSGRQVARDQEDYLLTVEACNGLSGPHNAALYKWSIDRYEFPLSRERAAQELYCTPEELTNAVAYSNLNDVLKTVNGKPQDLGRRLVELAQGEYIDRSAWEGDPAKGVQGDYLIAREVLSKWRQRVK